MSTPGRRRALKKLAQRKNANLRRVADGKKPIIGGKKVTPATYARRGGTASAKVARQRLADNKGAGRSRKTTRRAGRK